MQAYITLVRRELGTYFFSLTGYVVIAAVAVMLGLSFTEMLSALNASPTAEPLTELFYRTMFFWMVVLISAPVITMRSFALERSSGTFETLMTAPVGDLQVVLSKFTGAMIFYMVMWTPLLVCLAFLRHYASEPFALQPVRTFTSFGGIFLVGTLFISIGIFSSSVTRSQVVAAMLSFAIGAVFFTASFFAMTAPAKSGWWSPVFQHVSMIEHMQDFSRGFVDTRQILFYLSMTVWFLFLAVKAVESRRWK